MQRKINFQKGRTLVKIASFFLVLVFQCYSCDSVATFHNPILDTTAADPFVHLHSDGYYYLSLTDNVELFVYKSKILSDWRSAEKATVYRIPEGLMNLWAPEIHFVQGNWYIYFTMDNGPWENHRMYVIRAEDPENPQGKYTAEIRLNPPTPDEDYYGIDGTVLEYTDNKLYFLYSGCTENHTTSPQKLFIAPMANPTTISGSRTLIREPTTIWEHGLNEGPQILWNENRLFVVFSSVGEDYCLGLMGLDGGKDPLVAENWWHNLDGCVFWRNEETSVWAPGHASFTKSPDLKEDWILYHAMEVKDGGWPNRTARVERFAWNDDGTPNFPRPTGVATALPTPSGEN